MPQHPDVRVSLPSSPDTGLIRARVEKALKRAGYADAAQEYISQTDPIRENPEALMAASMDWVTINGADRVVPQAEGYTGSTIRALAEPLGEQERERWQYAVVNIGMFNSPERMGDTLATAGANSWELVTIYDKTSNWWAQMEKGFMLLKRPVPPGITPQRWCLVLTN